MHGQRFAGDGCGIPVPYNCHMDKGEERTETFLQLSQNKKKRLKQYELIEQYELEKKKKKEKVWERGSPHKKT